MLTRHEIWARELHRRHISRGSEEESSLIDELFGVSKHTFHSDLSRGFSARHSPAIGRLCDALDLPFQPRAWLRSYDSAPPIAWAGEPIHTADEFYIQLERLYASARTYNCLRVGGLFSRNRTQFGEHDELGLPVKPEERSVRYSYLSVFWKRVRDRTLSGSSVHVVKTVDRLVELWATVEILRADKLLNANPVLLAPIVPPGANDLPTIGVRTIDERKTLLSLPPPPEGESRYSWWIEADNLANFANDYINRMKPLCHNFSIIQKYAAETLFERAFEQLPVANSNYIGNYGVLDTFPKVRMVKDRMVEWAKGDKWLPVAA